MSSPMISLHLMLLLLLLLVTSISSQQQQQQQQHQQQQHQQQQHDLGHSRFVCTAIPADVDAACPLPALSGLSSGASDEARTGVLELRETVLRQKETILEQRESIRDLTTKLQRCEGTDTLASSSSSSTKHLHARLPGAKQAPGKWRDTMGDLPRDPGEVIEQLGRTVQSLKDRLESLEQKHRANSSRPQGSTGGAAGGGGVGGSAHSLREYLHERLGDVGKHLHGEGGDGEGGGHHNDSDGHPHHHQQQQQRIRPESTLTSVHRLPNLDKIGPPPIHHAPDDFKVMFPARTNYMFVRAKRSLPELHAFTICLWLRSGGPSSGTPFSYAVDDQPNELALMEWGNNPMELIINDKIARLPVSVSDGRWHHLCVTWSTRDGVWKAFQNGAYRGTGENLAPWRPIKAGGVLILGQEQDVVGGNFDATQAFLGEMAQFNVWDRELLPDEIMELATCSRSFSGNVVAWTEDAIDVHGGLTHHPFGRCSSVLSNF
uniref:Neuronal pentraxin-2-like isoform X1 n=1 Tax=Petromyzon marinus TaxID=7757 RepID=A0AAJ7TRK5_PETMA|nr:neuronal pentraxin-2-like isoform X1 [Petromyzon marinus]